ncbi:MAG: 2Fe-2S iron-sulfur cluster-binding protein [Planctomycetota bacterium]
MTSDARKTEFFSCVIDGKALKVRRGERLLEAARRGGIEIPGLCHHSSLSPCEACGLCQVEVRGYDGPQAACSLVVETDLQVRSRSPELDGVRRERIATLYRNHPAECPECDLNGDCSIQGLYLSHGQQEPQEKSSNQSPISAPIPLGPAVALHLSRCVGCELCVRFSAEIAGDQVLRMREEAGVKSVGLVPGLSLNGNYSLNTVDLCPAGALVSRELRARTPAWARESKETVCPGCATGCNAYLDFDRGRALRLRPRRNDEVNSSWMCDLGREESKQIGADRLSQPMASGIEVDWSGAIVSTSQILAPLREAGLNRIGAALSFDATCEEAWLLHRLMSEVFGQHQVAVLPRRAEGAADDFLLDADKHPNRLGVLLVLQDGVAPDPAAYFESLDAVIVMDVDPSAEIHDELQRRAYAGVKHRIVLSSRETSSVSDASVVLPMTSFAAKNGTWVNRQGRVQGLVSAVSVGAEFSRGRDALKLLTAIAGAMHVDWDEPSVPDLFAEISAQRPRFGGLAFDELGGRGMRLRKPDSAAGGPA